jgi:glyoxylase-like metal-dependent hydrolase (beta-lactamase superfamily II)/Tfp pilus assembly protein PilF
MTSSKLNHSIHVSIFLIALFLIPSPLLGKKDRTLEKALEQYISCNNQYTQGLQTFSNSNFEKAASAFQKCIQKFPQHAYAFYYLANLNYIQKDFDKALAHMEQAMVHFDFMQELSAYADKQKVKQMDTARSALTEMWDSTNSCRDSRAIELAWDLLEKEESDLELAAKKKQRRIERMKAHYTYFYGNIFFQLKQIPEAFHLYEESIKLDPQHPGAYNNLVAISYLAEQYPAALAFFEKAEEHGLDESLNLELKEKLYKAVGRPTEGILEEDLSAEKSDRTGIKRFALAYYPEKSMGMPNYVNCYIVYSPESKQAVLIDPGVNDCRIEDFIWEHNLEVKSILNTHDHSDHTGANTIYAELYNVPICAPKDDAEFYERQPDKLLEESDVLEYDGFKLKVLHTPGHTDGGLCFLTGHALFSGDTLFKNDIGRVWAEDSEKLDAARKDLIQNIREKILTLPADTLICPGHGKTTTVAAEKANNPVLK